MASAIDTSGEGFDDDKGIMNILSEFQAAVKVALDAAKSEITALQAASGGLADLNGLTDVVLTTPSNTQLLQFNGTNWVNATVGAAGEANTASNVGSGTGAVGVYKSKVGVNLGFKKLVPGSGVTLTDDTGTDTVIIGATGGTPDDSVRWINTSVLAASLGADWVCPGLYRYDVSAGKYIYDYRIQPQPTGEDVTATTISLTDSFSRKKVNYFFKVLSGTGSLTLPINQQDYYNSGGAPYLGHEAVLSFLLYPGVSLTFNRGSGAVMRDLTGTDVASSGAISGYTLVNWITKGTTYWRLS